MVSLLFQYHMLLVHVGIASIANMYRHHIFGGLEILQYKLFFHELLNDLLLF